MHRALTFVSVVLCLLGASGCGGESPRPDPTQPTRVGSDPDAGPVTEPVVQFDRVDYSYGASGEHKSVRVRAAHDARGAGWLVARIQTTVQGEQTPRVLAEAIVALSAGRTAVLDLAVPDSVLAGLGSLTLEATSEVRDAQGKVVATTRRPL
jgi:hypothetical protein